MTEYSYMEFRKKVNAMIAEPDSEEGQETIYSDSTHVAEIWQDGEITVTKNGDLYRHRRLHQSSPPLLPEGYQLFDAPRGENKRMIIVDDDLRDLINNTTVTITTTGISFEVGEDNP